jgi:UDP-N-acetylglucosamine 2-epimerase (non-hydrolysing)/GDP/UDP-N,N'-diacetylbacillosamine 2-epimerase (hydrolysing)
VSRTVTVVTGTRAEYGLLRPAMEAVRDHDELNLSIVATGMHLSRQHGYTVEEIERDGFDVDRRVYMQLAGDTGRSMGKSLGVGISGMAETLGSLDPDLVLVLGDRGEAFAGGVAAAHMNVPVAHVHGGDAMDGAIIDDSIRHALTKFAKLHFPVSERSAGRIERLGEEPWRITTVGAPGLDAIRDGEYASPEAVYGRYDIDPEKSLLLVAQHPVTTQEDEAGEQMRATLDAVGEFEDCAVVVVYPNADAGGGQMIEAIESHDANERFLTFESLPRRDFLGLMNVADCMVGNSSSGIIEAPSFDLPVVDVGPRQSGRQRAENTLSVPHDSEAIADAVAECLQSEERGYRNPYDYGGAGDRIAARIADVELGENLLRKRLTY